MHNPKMNLIKTTLDTENNLCQRKKKQISTEASLNEQKDWGAMETKMNKICIHIYTLMNCVQNGQQS